MSRRRASYQTPPPVTADELLAEVYGNREYREPKLVPGCVAACCRPGTVEQAEHAVWRAIHSLRSGQVWATLALEVAAIVAVLVGLAAWRWV